MAPAGDGWKKWALLGVLTLIWGSSFILMKRGLFHEGQPVLDPWQLASARLGLAWLTLSPLLFRHAALLRQHWRPLLLSGLLGNGIPAFLFAAAQTRIDSSLSGMLNSLTPLFTLLVGVWCFGTRIRTVHVAGVLLGLAGAVGLVLAKGQWHWPAWSLFAALPIVGTLCYGFSGNIVKRHLHMLPAEATACLALTFVGPVGCVGMLGTDLPTTVATHPHGWSALGYVAVLAVMSSAISLVLWNALLKKASAVWASSVTYLMPLVAIAWGVADGEVFTWAQFVMVLVVLSGVWLVTRPAAVE